MTADMTSETAMPIVFKKAEVNVIHVGAIIVTAIANIALVVGVYVNLTRDVAEIRDAQQTRAVVSDKSFDDIRAQIQPLPELRFQQSQQAAQIAELKAQMAALLERFGAKLDTLNENVNSVRTEVRVLAQEVRSNGDKKAQPTGFQP